MITPIIAPIKPGDTGASVANLQDALFALLSRNLIKALDAPNRPTADELQKLAESVKQERAQSNFGKATLQVILYFQLQQGLGDNLRGVVEEKTAAKLSELLKSIGAFGDDTSLVVRGTVRTADGQPIPGASVRAFDRDLRKLQPLDDGQTKTNDRGEYSIPYSPANFASGDVPAAQTPKLIVRAFVGDQQIGNDVSRPNPSREEVVNFQTAAPVVSEWEKLSAGIAPLLKGQGEGDQDLPPWEVKDSDLDFIADETGLDREKIRLWALAFAVGRDAAAITQTTTAIGASTHVVVNSTNNYQSAFAIFYGWFREGLPTEPDALWAVATDELVKRLKAAIDQHIVPAGLTGQIDLIGAQIDQHRIAVALVPSRPGSPPSLGDLLATMPTQLSSQHQTAVAATIATTSPDDPAFGQKLAAAGLTDAQQVISVQRTLRLGQFTLQNVQLTRELQAVVANDADASLKALAGLQRDDWLNLTYAHVPPAGSNLTPESYAAQLASALEAMHPTATLASQLTAGSLRLPGADVAIVAGFLSDNPDFDILKTNIGAYFSKKKAVLKGDGTTLAETVTTLQRVKRLNTTWDEVDALVNSGLVSALDVVALGPDRLADHLSGIVPEERTAAIASAAHSVHDRSLAMMVAYSPRFTPNFVGPLSPPVPIPDNPNLEGYPSLQALFGSLDTCACRDCRSVLSPAAYFADLLNFLKPSTDAFAELYRRRPDLWDLLLSCDNTDTELPYIDVVLEILENAVALPLKVTLPAGVDAEAALAHSPLGTAVTGVLARTTMDLGSGLTAQQEPSLLTDIDSHWTVTDRRRRWALRCWRQSFTAHVKPALSAVASPLLRSRYPLAVGPLHSIDAPTLTGQLDQGRLAGATQDWVVALLTQSADAGKNVGAFNVSIAPDNPGSSWTCHFQLGAVVEVAHDSDQPVGSLMLKSADGTALTPKTKPYFAAAITQTTTLLNQAKFGGLLSALLPAQDRYEIKTNSTTSWTVLGPVRTATLRYTVETVEVVSLAYQSSSTDRDLTVEPENRNPEAYRILQGTEAVFPWTLPFDLPLLELRGFLEKATVSRLSLMEACAPNTFLSSNDVALETLGLSSEAAALIVTPLVATGAVDPKLWACWGLTLDPHGNSTLYDASSGTTVANQPPLVLLSRVSLVLQQARLNFSELLALLETNFVSANRSAAISITPLGECDPGKLVLGGWTPAHLDRLHRFVRLWRALGWKPFELDLALSTPTPAAQLADPMYLLRKLSWFSRIQRRLNLSIEAIAHYWLGSFVAPVYHDYSIVGFPEIRPLYERIFLNPILQYPPDPALVPVGSPPELPGMPATSVADRVNLMAAALGLSPSDLLALAGDLPGAPGQLTLANLQTLFRTASLAKSLRLSIPAFQSARHLLNIDPFQGPDVLLQFCDQVTFLSKSGFSVDELAYLFLHDATAGLSISLTDELAAQKLRDLRAVLYADDQPIEAKRDVVITRMADVFSLDRYMMQDLLSRRLRSPADTTTAAIAILVEPAYTDSPETKTATTRANFPAAFDLIYRLSKLAVIITRLKIDATQLGWLSDPHTPPTVGFSALDPNIIPVAPPAPPLVTDVMTGWRRLVSLCQLRDRTTAMPGLISLYVAALTQDADKVCGVLAAGLQLDADVVKAAGALLGTVSIGDLADPLKLSDLVALLASVQKLGATRTAIPAHSTVPVLTDIALLTMPAPDFTASALARKLLISRNTVADGMKLIHDVSDDLRARQRDALVDYLIARDQFLNANELYEYYLIDVQMSPCMVTSRLLQSIAAVQLFIDRCLANLEPGLSLVARPGSTTEALRQQWGWMEQYRVWQANREIFLYPENWLYPDLRDNKTEIFATYESELAQTPPSTENAKEALLNYLSDLADHAQITVIGMYLDPAALYVIGRSPNKPYQYFWRTCDNFLVEGMQWTGWEKVALDLSSEHAVPFVFEGDLHVAWPVIQKSQGDSSDQPWQVQLAWARHTARGWSKKKLSRDSLSVIPLANRDERTLLAFRAASATAGGGMDILCYAAKSNAALSVRPDTADATEHFRVGNPIAEPNQKTVVKFVVRAFLKFDDSTPPSYQDATDISFFGLGFFCGAYDTFNVQTQVKELISFSSDSQRLSLLSETDDPEYWFVIGSFTKEIQNLTSPTNPFTLEFQATANFSGKALPQCTLTVTGLTPQSVQTCLLEFIFQAGTNPNPAVTGDVPLSMEYQGRFAFKNGREVELIENEALTPLALPVDTYAYMSGFRETKTADEPAYVAGFSETSIPFNGLSVPFPPIFGRSAEERFFVCKAGQSDSQGVDTKTDLWYFEEGLSRYFLVPAIANSPLSFSIFPGSLSFSLSLPGFTSSLSIFPASYKEVADFIPRAYDGLGTLYDPANEAATFGTEDLGTYLTGSAYPLSEDPRQDSTGGYDLRMPYALYQWETFLHLPLRTAQYLTGQQRFEDAQTWLHLVFDPTTSAPGTDPARYWRFLPFRENIRPANIQQLLTQLADPNADPAIKKSVTTQIDTWRENPFLPHAVARYRPSAYQWSTVFAYLDNLISWGDQLFRQDTREPIAKATQVYVRAANILGPRPRSVEPRVTAPILSYRELAGSHWDDFSNVWLEFTDLQSAMGLEPEFSEQRLSKQPSSTQGLTSLGMLYFCVPTNDRLATYWTQIEDRLFKIRHCQNIDGVVQQLPLWAPPIDPGLLVRAAAAGLDLSAVLADQTPAVLPNYRFTVLAQKTSELCNELKALSGGLLSALEKKDAEQLALLRSSQEIELLNLVTRVRQQQVDEAQAQVDALLAGQQNVLERLAQYQRLLGETGLSLSQGGDPVVQQSSPLQFSKVATGDSAGLGLIKPETDQIGKLNEALGWAWTSGIASTVASILHILPDYQAGSLVFQIKFGGTNLGLAASAIASLASTLEKDASHHATISGMFAGYQRRCDEWIFQSRLAVGEYRQQGKQILAAQIRLAIAQNELDNHEQQIENAQAVDDFMRREKFTSRDLYGWMQSQLSTVYFSAYQLVYDLAKRTEYAYRYELGLQDSNFIQFGSWDSLKKGLLAGERLHSDLRRMEVAYLNENKREHELIKHVSLRRLDPLQLLQLRATGSCTFTVPEWLFDMDCSGHYLRRLKSVALSLPAVTGPYTSVNATLTLKESWVRISPDPALPYERDPKIPSNVERFVQDFGQKMATIVTSTGSNDSGLFEINLRDERFLPFEGGGAESTWSLELPQDFRQFDYDTIADVVLHMRYTARTAPAPGMKTAASDRVKAIAAIPANFALLLSLGHDFPTEWAAFASGTADFSALIRREMFPYFTHGWTIKISGFEVYGEDPNLHHSVGSAGDLGVDQAGYTLTATDAAPDPKVMIRDPRKDVGLIVNYSLSKSNP